MRVAFRRVRARASATHHAPLAASFCPPFVLLSSTFIFSLYLRVAVTPCPASYCFGLLRPGAGFKTHSDSGLGLAAAAVRIQGSTWYALDTAVSK